MKDIFKILGQDNKDIWRAINLLVQEVGSTQGTSQWFRDEWQKLVDDMKKRSDNERHE